MIELDAPPVVIFDVDALPTDWEALTSAGREMTAAADRQRWQLGDLGNKVQRTYGAESLKTFAGEINLPRHKTLYEYARVARQYEPSIRLEFPALSWSHFQTALRAKDDAALYLMQAQDNGWPVAELAKQIAAAIGKPIPPTKVWEGKVVIGTDQFGGRCLVYCDDPLTGVEPGKVYRVAVYTLEAA